MIISIHVPKTAGTTFRELLAGHFGEDLCLFYAGYKNHRMEPVDDVPAHARCIHGHMHARDFDHRYPGAKRVVWLRHPVERVASEYAHHRRHPSPDDELSRLAAANELVEFARHPSVRSLQTRVLQGLRVKDFAFVGISEAFDDELGRLHAATGIALPRGHRVNTNPARHTPRYPLGPRERRVLADLDQDGMELYKEALDAAGLDPALAA
ncbi:MAG TPA: hypothetical protein VG936_12980 [Lacunisphaera sp.]|nr:hypothetical protein [Lacunisphaera sp.]